ncbi:hypothetical protein F4810DRAFT_711087 [Camillea tinctor]|nr:hypothetical protein F4810DRAFT_711087 [Camillea tinctor]
MPVTIQVASHPAEAITARQHECSDSVLHATAKHLSGRIDRVLQSTLSDGVGETVLPMKNGLVLTCLRAYNNHHHLVLRPDDVWIAIITQFSFYVNKHAEELRSLFVRHKGKQELVVETDVSKPDDIDFSRMTAEISDKIHENIVDKDLQAWITPSFSTTTEIDAVVCSAIFMSTMKEYFEYRFRLLCGIPSVTLLGDVSDWEEILQRLDKLKSFGSTHEKLERWRILLVPVIQNMIRCFHVPEEQADFWSRICHRESFGSGPRYLSGWITAFCVFSNKGDWQGDSQMWNARHLDFGNRGSRDGDSPEPELQRGALTDITGKFVTYPYIDDADVPPSWSWVDVKIELATSKPSIKLNAMIVSGLIGASVFPLNPEEKTLNTVQPFPAWWIFTVKGEDKDADSPRRYRSLFRYSSELT